MKYVELARGLGFWSDDRMDMGTEAVATAEALCKRIAREFSHFAGLNAMVLPVRVMEEAA